MEIVILKFSGSNDADDALGAVTNAEGDRRPWLHEVSVVRRPTVGRISIRGTYADRTTSSVKEGELASRIADMGGLTGYFIGSLLGPLHADTASLTGELRARAAGKALEKEFFHTDEIKRAMPRGSSALILVAPPEVTDEFVSLFKDRGPEVIRRNIEQEVEKRLEEALQASP